MLTDLEKEIFVRIIKEKIKEINNLQVIKIVPTDSLLVQAPNKNKN
jgi:hypothetical protein